ncbi:hypothetical protein MAPG_05905 [Magnaporthiopsis poae ATCC 64411]|uniref:Uncharacterized protein n=1 Tax=Magnaporthiopsis poae (strain ATCC 64411 / 73-15) TaxID=644358 RepID=A0A0C4E0M4_MAGP6|nr:hypothetical protein MAPG_05905 [Magnaporthiopsis poae ATCC 64411]
MRRHPGPEYKTAVVLLLSSNLITLCVLFPFSLIPHRVVGYIALILSLVLSAATLAVVVIRWNEALAIAGQWAVPYNVDPALIPEEVNPTLWKLVRNRQYGIGITVGAAVDLAVHAFAAALAIVLDIVSMGQAWKVDP